MPEAPSSRPPARYIMIGGFLGAGKSTAVLALARHLRDRGLRVGLITNDQSVGLVDTVFLKSGGFPVEEIAGGCFCCRFDSLVEAAGKLSQAQTPDVFIAEPVGSCTDLVATVSYPLRRLYGEKFSIAPLSVLVDPVRAARIFGLMPGRKFSDKVLYVYRKQIEEAELLVINKSDLVSPALLADLSTALQQVNPAASVFCVSVRQGEGLEPWFSLLDTAVTGTHPAMQVDYGVYAEGEALLGWLNATIGFRGENPLDIENIALDLAERIRADLTGRSALVAHLKMTVTTPDQPGQSAVLNLVNNDFVPELAQSLPQPCRRGQLIVNLRGEADPEVLENVLNHNLRQALNGIDTITYWLEHLDRFRPAPPTPRWRMSHASSDL